jgi:hypothetical protein
MVAASARELELALQNSPILACVICGNAVKSCVRDDRAVPKLVEFWNLDRALWRRGDPKRLRARR